MEHSGVFVMKGGGPSSRVEHSWSAPSSSSLAYRAHGSRHRERSIKGKSHRILSDLHNRNLNSNATIVVTYNRNINRNQQEQVDHLSSIMSETTTATSAAPAPAVAPAATPAATPATATGPVTTINSLAEFREIVSVQFRSSTSL
ncbi:hypothetical protein FRC18_002733 [Serendipita sp. 400]|nr:hypothetical protein FRC18_002733 [Serendipita sp. 400]